MSPEERGGGEKNDIYSGHLRLCQQPRAVHALRSDQINSFQNSLSIAEKIFCFQYSVIKLGNPSQNFIQFPAKYLHL
jgi:hypothetical protein